MTLPVPANLETTPDEQFYVDLLDAGRACSADRREFVHLWRFKCLDPYTAADQLGKSPGKDEAAGKLTYVTLFGLEEARQRLAALELELGQRAAEIEGADGPLAAIARYVARRRS